MSWSAWWVAAAALMQVALVLGLLGYLGWIRIPLVMRGEIKLRDVALSREPWPEREKQVSNAVDNQFQLPILFYVGVFCVLATSATILDVVLCWAFVITRYVHAFIFITDNNVTRRFLAYAVGYLILCLLWLTLAFRLVVVFFALGVS
jgi:hypothetical protein